MQESTLFNPILVQHFENSSTLFQLSELHQLKDLNDLLACSPHQNDYFQLVLYTKGKGLHKVDTRTIPYHAHTLIPVAKGQVQLISCSHDSEAFILSFAEEFLNRYDQDMEWFYNLCLFDPNRQNGAIFPAETDCHELISLIGQMQSEIKRNPLDYQSDILRDLLRIFINRSERLLDSQTAPKVEGDYALYCNFRRFLEMDFQICHTVNVYAKKLFITPKKLNQMTLKYAHKNAKEMINERLLLEIKRLLLYSNFTIKAIATQTGFDDPTNFVKFFKRYIKMTPEKYRVSHKNGAF